jgi:hypothetical protein
MTLTDKETGVVMAVFSTLAEKTYDELNGGKETRIGLGSLTIQEMTRLRTKIEMADYCERHHVAFEELTEEDFEAKALEDIHNAECGYENI